MKKIEESKILNLYKKGLNDSEIGRVLKCNNATITLWRKRNELVKNFKYKTKVNEEKFLEYYNSGLKDVKIAEILNVSRQSVRYIREKLKLPYNNTHNLIELTNIQKQVIIGGLLGDSSIIKKYKNAKLSFSHSLKQENYAKYKNNLLGELMSGMSYEHNLDKRTNKVYSRINFWSKCHPNLNYYYNKFYIKGKKILPIDLLYELDTLGLSIWFQDDGYKNYPGLSIATNCFTLKELETIKIFFKTKFDINVSIHKSANIIYIEANQTDKFTNLIKKHIQEECKYKLHRSPE